MTPMLEPEYIGFLQELKETILRSRYQAAKLVNRELILLYFQTGKKLSEKINAHKWGAKVIDNISNDLQRELPGLRGFSVTNLKKMRHFYETYSFFEISPSSTAQFETSIKPSSTVQFKLSVKAIHNVTKVSNYPLGIPVTEAIQILETSEFIDKFLSISFTHHILLLSKIKSWDELFFYVSKTLENQWSVSILQYHIESALFAKQGKLLNNFNERLPEKVYPHALQAFKEEYLFDFLNIQAEDEQDERVFETEIVRNIKQFILSIGKEFTFMGNQYRLVVNGDEFFIDLLFYHRGLQCMIAFELKTGKFKPEYAGKLNFYLNALDEYVKLPHENTSIGIILCKEKNDTVVEFAFKTIDKPMGVATYKFTTELPEQYKKYLPNSEDLRKLM